MKPKLENYLYVFEFSGGYEAFAIATSLKEAKEIVIKDYRRLLNNFTLTKVMLKLSRKTKSPSCEIRFYE